MSQASTRNGDTQSSSHHNNSIRKQQSDEVVVDNNNDVGGGRGEVTRINSVTSTWSEADKGIHRKEEGGRSPSSSSLSNSDDDEANKNTRPAGSATTVAQQSAPAPAAPPSFWERVSSCCCCRGRGNNRRRGDSSNTSSSSMSSTEDDDTAPARGGANNSLEDSFLNEDEKQKSEQKIKSSSSSKDRKSKKSKSGKDKKEKAGGGGKKGDSGYDVLTLGDTFKVTITDVIYDYKSFDFAAAEHDAKSVRKVFCEKHRAELLEFAKLRSDAESAAAARGMKVRSPRGGGNTATIPTPQQTMTSLTSPSGSVIKPAPVFTSRSTPQTYSNYAHEDVCYIVPRPLADKIPINNAKNGIDTSLRLEEAAKKYTYLSNNYSSKEEHDVFSSSHHMWLECKRGKSFPRAWRCYTPKPARVVDLKMVDKDHSVLSKICLHRGPVQELGTVAVVNAANERCLGGGGVDSAVHAGAGPLLLRECCSFNGCAVGHTRLTKGYNLPAKFVLHTVGPQGENRSALRSCYITCLDLCRLNGIKSVAFCAISTGIYGYPLEKATKVAIATVAEYISLFPMDFTAVVFSCFREEEYEVYKRYLRVTVADVLQTLNESGRRSDLERQRQSVSAPNGGGKSSKSASRDNNKKSSSVGKKSSSKARPNDDHGGGLPFASNGVSSAGSPNHSSAGDRDDDDDDENSDQENRSDPLSRANSSSRSKSLKSRSHKHRVRNGNPSPASTTETKHQQSTDDDKSRPRSKSAAEAFVDLFSPTRSAVPNRRNAASSVTSHPFRDSSKTGDGGGGRNMSSSARGGNGGGKPTLEVPEVDQEASFGTPSTREPHSQQQQQTQAEEEKALLDKLWREAMQAEADGGGGVPLQEQDGDAEFWQPDGGADNNPDGAYDYGGYGEDGADDGISLTRDVSLEIVPIGGSKMMTSSYNGIVRRSDDDEDSDDKEEMISNNSPPASLSS